MTCHVLISGFVQGIGFRAFVKKHARELGLTGWVANTQDGKVEAVLQGRTENIKKMILLCRKGPFLADVKDLKIEWRDPAKGEAKKEEGYDSFEVVR